MTARSSAIRRSEVCVLCGFSLEGMRSDALYCSGACRAEGGRLRAILRGEAAQGYRSVVQRLNARRRRTTGLRRSPEAAGWMRQCDG